MISGEKAGDSCPVEGVSSDRDASLLKVTLGSGCRVTEMVYRREAPLAAVTVSTTVLTPTDSWLPLTDTSAPPSAAR